MMLHQARNVRFVFQQKYGLAQPNCLSPAPVLSPRTLIAHCYHGLRWFGPPGIV